MSSAGSRSAFAAEPSPLTEPPGVAAGEAVVWLLWVPMRSPAERRRRNKWLGNDQRIAEALFVSEKTVEGQ